MKSSRSLLSLALAVVAAAAGFGHAAPAHAARCSADAAGNWTCSYQQGYQSYRANNGFGYCIGSTLYRQVRWQVPEGTPPAGGWPVVFYYMGTTPAGSSLVNPFVQSASASFGSVYATRAIHELLDDPNNTGRKYAVIAAEAPLNNGMQFWHTNAVQPYSASADYCFFPAFFSAISGGSYGAASQYNMGRRFAFGISSGGYNTSRMAVTFNSGGNFKALAIVAASYATCAGPSCSVPSTLPANHPPTKFWHGTADNTVPISTMRPYHDRLVARGVPAAKVEHGGGHAFTSHILGTTGIRNWFDRY